MVLNPGLALGEGYMDGTIVPVGCSLYDALDLLMTNLVQGGRQPVMALHGVMAAALKRWAQFQPRRPRPPQRRPPLRPETVACTPCCWTPTASIPAPTSRPAPKP